MSQTILVVEDEEGVRESVAALLEVEGYNVSMATNGAQALSVLHQSGDVALIVLDLMMPQVDGWAFRARQLNQPKLAAIPVVVLSGARQIERELTDLDPAAVLRKPTTVDDLLDTVAACVGRA